MRPGGGPAAGGRNLGRHRCHRRVETQQSDRIHTELAQDLDLLRARVSRGGGVPWEKNSRGSGSNATATAATPKARAGNRVAHQRTMAQVEAVKCTDTDHASVGNSAPPSTLLNSLLINSFRPDRGRRFNGVTLKYSRHGARSMPTRSRGRKPIATMATA